jgi:uncharacterized protein
MNCPVCTDERLVMADRQGIEIDYCPKCRGVWLDRGELDKIIERAAVEAASVRPAAVAPAPVPTRAPAPVLPPPSSRPWRDDDDDDDDDWKRRDPRYGKPSKKKSVLKELFDF